MHRLDVATAASVLPTPAAAGTPGFHTNGNPGTGTPASVMDADFFNAVQEELIAILVEGGINPVKGTNTQVRDAIRAMINGQSKWQGYGAWLASDQTIATATWTKLAFATIDFNWGGAYSGVNARFTPTVAGLYDISVNADLKVGVDQAIFNLGVYVNGSLARAGAGVRASGTGHFGASLNTKVYLNGSTDYLEIFAYQSTGANQSVDSTNALTHVQVIRVA
jgi:hypothetical protein